MSMPDIKIEFDGGDADRHLIDMKYYSIALQGAEAILSDGIILLDKKRLPKPRERAQLLVKVRETKAGSHITPTDLSDAYQMLQLGLPILNDIGAEFLYNWVKSVIAHFSNNESDLNVAMTRMLELNNAHLAARDKSEERVQEDKRMRHEEGMLDKQIILEAIKALSGPAEKFVAPVGASRSVNLARISTFDNMAVEADENTAIEIREHNKVIWEKIAAINLETDGFKFHTNGLSVRNPEGEGWLMANVKDPSFVEEDNEYTEAAQKRATINVLARKGRRNGVLAKLEILEFVGVVKQ